MRLATATDGSDGRGPGSFRRAHARDAAGRGDTRRNGRFQPAPRAGRLHPWLNIGPGATSGAARAFGPAKLGVEAGQIEGSDVGAGSVPVPFGYLPGRFPEAVDQDVAEPGGTQIRAVCQGCPDVPPWQPDHRGAAAERRGTAVPGLLARESRFGPTAPVDEHASGISGLQHRSRGGADQGVGELDGPGIVRERQRAHLPASLRAAEVGVIRRPALVVDGVVLLGIGEASVLRGAAGCQHSGRYAVQEKVLHPKLVERPVFLCRSTIVVGKREVLVTAVDLTHGVGEHDCRNDIEEKRVIVVVVLEEVVRKRDGTVAVRQRAGDPGAVAAAGRLLREAAAVRKKMAKGDERQAFAEGLVEIFCDPACGNVVTQLRLDARRHAATCLEDVEERDSAQHLRYRTEIRDCGGVEPDAAVARCPGPAVRGVGDDPVCVSYREGPALGLALHSTDRGFLEQVAVDRPRLRRNGMRLEQDIHSEREQNCEQENFQETPDHSMSSRLDSRDFR